MIFKLYFVILISFLAAFIEGAKKKSKCGANMEKKKCRACTDTCAFTKSIPPKPLKKCYDKKDKECKKNKGSVCVCKKGFYLNDKNKCVKKNECYGKPPTTKKPKTTTPKCKKNEVWDSYPDGCEIKCSDDPKRVKDCFNDIPESGACVCKKDYVRDEVTGDCVKRKDCTKTSTPLPTTIPKCKENEVWDSCGNLCEPMCTDDPDKEKLCPLVCNPGACVCKDGYVRDDFTFKCVNRDNCTKIPTPWPTTESQCGEHEEFNKCGTACPITCRNYYNKPKECTSQCVAICECHEGYIRDEITDECVRPSNCSVYTKYECPENEHFEKCSTACPITCSNYNNPPKVCTYECRIGCVCNKGFVRNEKTQQCVRSSECSSGTTVEPQTTPVCSKNMVYTKCKSACPPRCGIPANVTSICTKECAGEGCECREPFALDEFENCVRREECKKPSKGGYYIIHMLRKTVTSMYTLIFRH